MKANTKRKSELCALIETMRNGDAYLFSMQPEAIREAIQRISPEDKKDLKELMENTLGEERRFQIVPSDTREWTFWIRPVGVSDVLINGKKPDGYDEEEHTDFFIRKGKWCIQVYTLCNVQRGKWHAQQNICLVYEDVQIALLSNATVFFKDSVVVSPVLHVAESLAQMMNEILTEAKVHAYNEQDFVCMAAAGISKKEFLRRDVKIDGIGKEEALKELAEHFREMHMIDSETKCCL